MANDSLIIRLANGSDLLELVDAVPAHVEAVLAEVVVVTIETVETLAADGLLLQRALVTKVLLREWFVKLEAV